MLNHPRWLWAVAALAVGLLATATPPTISNTPDQATDEDTPKGPIAVTVDDAETPGLLSLAGLSSNTTLVPNGNIALGSLSDTERTVLVTPAADQFGTATITLTVTDAAAESTSDTFVLTVAALNDADNDSYVINEDTTLTKDAAGGVLANDNDVPGHTLIAIYEAGIDTAPAHGTLSCPFDGSFTYRPARDYFGTDSFTYRVQVDGNPLTQDTGVVSLYVNAVNDAPVVANQSTNVWMNHKRSITLHATDVDNAPGDLTYTIVSQPGNGTLTGTAPNLTYEPDGGFAGTDDFTFKANDGLADSATGNVRITVRIIKEEEDKSSLSCTLATTAAAPCWPAFVGGLLPLLLVLAGLGWRRGRRAAAGR